jgi:hypothetical protein
MKPKKNKLYSRYSIGWNNKIGNMSFSWKSTRKFPYYGGGRRYLIKTSSWSVGRSKTGSFK